MFQFWPGKYSGFIPVYSGYSRYSRILFRDFYKGDCMYSSTHILKSNNKGIKMACLVLKWNADHLNIPQPEALTQFC